MNQIRATIKAPVTEVKNISEQLEKLGVKDIEIRTVPHHVFVQESRLNYDCVFPQMWDNESEAVYITFYFEATAEGRKAAFRVEYGLMQIPLNLRYEF